MTQDVIIEMARQAGFMMENSAAIQAAEIFAKLVVAKERKLLTDEKICLIAHNTDPNDWDDLTFKKCWHEGFKAGFREAEIEHNIKG